MTSINPLYIYFLIIWEKNFSI